MHSLLLAFLLVAGVYAKPQYLPVYPTVPVIPTVYHTDEQANCKLEYVDINRLECKPRYDIVCTDEQKLVDQIKYRKICKTIVDVICGSHDQPVKVGQITQNLPGTNRPSEATPEAYHNFFRHNCYDVPKDYCYAEPYVEAAEQETPVCHVETKAECEEVTTKVPKYVCNHEPERPERPEVETQEGSYNEVEQNTVEAGPVVYAASPIFTSLLGK